MVRSRYCGPARPRTIYKKWLQDGLKADSWSYNQSEEPEIYLRPRPEPEPVSTPAPTTPAVSTPLIIPVSTPSTVSFSHIHNQGYPYDLEEGDAVVDLELNSTDTFYDLNG